MFSKELRKFSESLIEPSKVGGSAIQVLGPVLEFKESGGLSRRGFLTKKDIN